MGNIKNIEFNIGSIHVILKVLEQSTYRTVIECNCGIVHYKSFKHLEQALRRYIINCNIKITKVEKSFRDTNYKFTFIGEITQQCSRCGGKLLSNNFKTWNRYNYCPYCYEKVRYQPSCRKCNLKQGISQTPIHEKYCMYCLDHFRNIELPKAYAAGVIQDGLVRGVIACENCSNYTEDVCNTNGGKICYMYLPKRFLTRTNSSGYDIIL